MQQHTFSIFILGCRGSGKTSFISGLCQLSRPSNNSKFKLISKNPQAVQLVSELRTLAEHGEWPAATSSLTPIDFQLTLDKGLPLNLSLLDYPGEDLEEAMQALDFESRELIQEHLMQADCLLMLLDPTQDLESSLTEDATNARKRQDALANAAGLLLQDRLEKKHEKPIIACVISKRDLFQCNTDQESLEQIRNNNQHLLLKLAGYAKGSGPLEIFPISACGALPENDSQNTSYPESPKPEGYETLFSWIESQRFAIATQKRRTAFYIATIILLLIVATYLGWNELRQNRITQIITTAPIVEVARTLGGTKKIIKEQRNALDERVNTELNRLKTELKEAVPATRYKTIITQIEQLLLLPHIRNTEKLKELRVSAISTWESSIYESIKARVTADKSPSETLNQISSYLEEFPNGQHKQQVLELQKRIDIAELTKDIAKIRRITVKDKSSLRQKSIQISKLLSSHIDIKGRKEIDIALRVALDLETATKFRLKFSSCGFSGSKRDHKVQWLLKEKTKATFESATESTQSTFERTIYLSPAEFKDLAIAILDLDLWNEVMAVTPPINIFTDLQCFSGKEKINLATIDDWPHAADAWVKASISIPDRDQYRKLTDAEIEAYSHYIYPGEAW